MYNKLIFLWNSETPKLARFMQVLAGALAAMPAYYSTLPEPFQSTITPDMIKFITWGSIATAFLCQFFKTNDK